MEYRLLSVIGTLVYVNDLEGVLGADPPVANCPVLPAHAFANHLLSSLLFQFSFLSNLFFPYYSSHHTSFLAPPPHPNPYPRPLTPSFRSFLTHVSSEVGRICRVHCHQRSARYRYWRRYANNNNNNNWWSRDSCRCRMRQSVSPCRGQRSVPLRCGSFMIGAAAAVSTAFPMRWGDQSKRPRLGVGAGRRQGSADSRLQLLANRGWMRSGRVSGMPAAPNLDKSSPRRGTALTADRPLRTAPVDSQSIGGSIRPSRAEPSRFNLSSVASD